MPEKIFTTVLSLALRPKVLAAPSAAGVQGLARAPEEMVAVDVGHGAVVAVRRAECQKAPG